MRRGIPWAAGSHRLSDAAGRLWRCRDVKDPPETGEKTPAYLPVGVPYGILSGNISGRNIDVSFISARTYLVFTINVFQVFGCLAVEADPVSLPTPRRLMEMGDASRPLEMQRDMPIWTAQPRVE